MKSLSFMRRTLIPVLLGFGAMLPAIGMADSNIIVPISSVLIYRGAVYPAGLVTFSSNLQHPEGCTSVEDNVVVIDFSSTTQPDGKSLYAAVLAAFLAGRNVQIGVRGCYTNGAPLVYSIQIMP